MTQTVSTTLCDRPAAPAPRLRAVLLGCGVVGGGVADQLPETVTLVGVLARTPRPGGIAGAPVFTDPDAVFALKPDVVIEALPGGRHAETLLERAVDAGAHIVTANKDVAARRADLGRRAKSFACAAAVGGGAPVLETVERLKAAGRDLTRVRGVLNGTSNFVLDRLAQGEALETAVTAAQQAGFAEADPSADLDGIDAANKLVLIARAAWGIELDPADIDAHSITDLPAGAGVEAARRGRVLRQVATLSRSELGVKAKVRLDALPPDDPLARTRGEGNSVVLTPQRGPAVIVAGKGAGRGPTAASVLGDVARLVARTAP